MRCYTALILYDTEVYEIIIGRSPSDLRHRLLRYFNGIALDNGWEPLPVDAETSTIVETLRTTLHPEIRLGEVMF